MDSYLPPKCGYSVVGKHIKTDKSVMNKVTGTAMGGILSVSPWSTPFQVACNLLGLAVKDISDKPAVQTGRALEERIVRYADRRYPEHGQFLTAIEAGFEERIGDHDSWGSDFEDEIFAGHVDGIVLGEGANQYILEIKTSGNLESWSEGVPEYYKLQVQLYNHFLAQQDKAYVVLGIMNPYTYRDPASWIPHEENCFLFEMNTNQEEFRGILDRVREWYIAFIQNGVTPDYDPTNEGDVALYNHLVDLSTGMDEFQELVDAYTEVDQRIRDVEESISTDYAVKESLKTRLREYMSAHDLSQLPSPTTTYYASLSTRESVSLDEARMIADGIDLEKYKVRKVVKTFTLKKSKE